MRHKDVNCEETKFIIKLVFRSEPEHRDTVEELVDAYAGDLTDKSERWALYKDIVAVVQPHEKAKPATKMTSETLTAYFIRGKATSQFHRQLPDRTANELWLDHLYDNAEKLLGAEIGPIYSLKLDEWRVGTNQLGLERGYSWERVHGFLKLVEANFKAQANVGLRFGSTMAAQQGGQQVAAQAPQAADGVSDPCWNCGVEGHKSFRCPHKPGKAFRKPGGHQPGGGGYPRGRTGSDGSRPTFVPNGAVTPMGVVAPQNVSLNAASVFKQPGLYSQLYRMVGDSAGEQRDARGQYVTLLIEFRSGKRVDAVCDTGCSGIGIMDSQMPEKLGVSGDLIPFPTKVTLADKSVKESTAICRTKVRAGTRFDVLDFVVLPQCDFDLLIGKGGLEKFHLLFGFNAQVDAMNAALRK